MDRSAPSRLAAPLNAAVLSLTLSMTTVIALTGCNEILGFGDPLLDPSGSGGNASGGPSAGPGGSGGEAPPPPCHPSLLDSCNAVDHECLGLVDNSALDSVALRVSQVTIFEPQALAPPGPENAIITGAVLLNMPDCNLKGSGYLSWIIGYDKTTGTGRVGVSKPVADPFDGYSFVDEILLSNGVPFQVRPFSAPTTIDPDGTINLDVVDYVVLPVYTDAMGSDYILVPLHNVRISDTKISPDYNCIGSYNAAGLRPEDGCLQKPADNIYAFIDGGKMEGYILLEEADNIIIGAFGLNRSLCVILSGNASVFGMGSNPIVCDRQGPNNEIQFPGNWCSTTDSPGDGNCHDAVLFSQGFAASSVKLNE